MPAIDIVLAQFAEKLGEGGSQSSNIPMAIMSQSMSFVRTLGRPIDDDVAVAGYIASQFQFPDGAQIAAALGIPATLIPTHNAKVGDTYVLMDILAQGSADQATVAAITLYAWCARAAQQGNDADVRRFREVAGITSLPGSAHQALGRTLENAMNAIAIAAPLAARPTEYLFSISIDLCGSTDAKTRILRNAGGDQSKIDHYNELVYREFCSIEARFFAGLVRQYGFGEPINPDQLFTVKGIGDELWTLCSVNENELLTVGQRLVDAAIEIANLSVSLAVPEHDDNGHFDQHFNYGYVAHVQSPIKVFIDLVAHATPISEIRDRVLQPKIPEWIKTFKGLPASAAETAYVARRLYLSAYEPIGRLDHHQIRTDYIGHEIDRFFRTTKGAKPGTVSVGSAMVEKLALQERPVVGDILQLAAPNGPKLRGGIPNDALFARPETLENLKGLGYDYKIYMLFNALMLKGNYVRMEAHSSNGENGSAYDETATVLPPDLIDVLSKKAIRDRNDPDAQ